MKTLILYATKYGCTKSLAERLSTLIGNTTLCNLKSDKCPLLSEFDCVILGSSLYAGMIRRELKTFVNTNVNELKAKRLGLFLCALDAQNADVYFSKNFPEEILNIAHAKGFLGGTFDKDKAGRLDKLILKVVKKSAKSISIILEDNIMTFANVMKEVSK